MDRSREFWTKAFFFTLLGLSVLVFFVYEPLKRSAKLDQLKKEGVYTIGYIYKIEDPLRSTPFILYYYNINGIKLSGTEYISSYNEEYVGRSYYVKVLPSDFSFSKILLNKPVGKEVDSQPSMGWKKMPE